MDGGGGIGESSFRCSLLNNIMIFPVLLLAFNYRTCPALLVIAARRLKVSGVPICIHTPLPSIADKVARTIKGFRFIKSCPSYRDQASTGLHTNLQRALFDTLELQKIFFFGKIK